MVFIILLTTFLMAAIIVLGLVILITKIEEKSYKNKIETCYACGIYDGKFSWHGFTGLPLYYCDKCKTIKEAENLAFKLKKIKEVDKQYKKALKYLKDNPQDDR